MYDPERYNKRRAESEKQAISAEVAARCPHGNCGCNMRFPVDWEQAEGTIWRVTLRCPNCNEWDHAKMGEEAIEKFDAHLDRGTDKLVTELRNLTYQNMVMEINAFVGALDADHILPEDF